MESKEIFRQGQCHALALVANEITGLPLYAVVDEEGVVDHVVVFDAEGTEKVFDVDGWRAPSEFFDEPAYGWAETMIEMTRDKIIDYTESNGWSRPDYDTAKKMYLQISGKSV